MAALNPGSDRFKPLVLLKQGRFSVVTKLLETATQRERVGRLLLLPAAASELTLLQGIDRLQRVLRSFSHPHVVPFVRVLEGDGGTWMLFDYAPGVPMSHYIGAEHTISDAWIIRWLAQLLEALTALHAHEPPVVCGYIEPDDVVVSGDQLWLCDLGLFEDVFPEVAASTFASHPLVNFLAPEKRNAPAQVPSTDIYSAGAITFWLVTGHPPALLSAATTMGPNRVASTMQHSRPEFPAAVSSLVSSMMAFYPSQRPTAAEARAALQPYLMDLARQSPPTPPAVTSKIFAPETRLAVVRESPKTLSKTLQAEAPDRPEPDKTIPTTPPPLWEEFLEDIGWALQRHPKAIMATALLLLVGGGALLRYSLAPASLPPALLTVTSGTVLGRMPKKDGKPHGEWSSVHEVRPGTEFTGTNSVATLTYHHSFLTIYPNTVLICEDSATGAVLLLLERGRLAVRTGNEDTVQANLSPGNFLMVESASDATLDMNSSGKVPHYEFLCRSGKAEVTFESEQHKLEPGIPLNLSEQK